MIRFISGLFFVLASCNLYAESFLDNAIFGVSVINQDINLEVKQPGNTLNLTESGTGVGVYLDKYYAGKYRFNSTISYVAYDEFDLASLSLSADYLVPFNKELSFFVGVSGGAGMQQHAEQSVSDASVGLIYGVQLGGIAYLSKQVMAEIGYRQKSANIVTDVTAANITETVINEVDEIYLSLLLMF